MRPPLVKSLLKAMIAILLTMIVLEVTKTYIFPKITILGSYIITITFSTLTGTVVSGYVLLKYEKLNQNLGNHILERERLASELQNLNEVLELKVQERSRQLLAAQDELARNDKLAVLGQVAGSVGHELRNPLGVMNNAVYFLQTVLSDADETTKEYLGIIKEEIAVSDRIVGDLLDSVRIKPPHPEAVGVGDLIGHVLRKCTIPENVTIVQEIPDGLPPLKADPLQIHQVLRNLVSNALDAMPDGGTLEFRAERAVPDAIMLKVRDTGVGMTSEQLGKLFQPLFTTKARGIGLGLVVVKNLTQANGGEIEVKSEAGKGTTFFITLPCAGPQVETAGEQEA
ncbi:two-component system sensor histidine kinase NtrB [Ferrovum myxofaciens]|uniref:histidine kinase n=2 Tax=Ferrovum myxofaciens TaxID=416213 RepID=A0A9E6MWC4_9PROT|nr:ATP-binding protein [Ferrovum myxofaciens]MBU6995728.1 hypothetical protein [Ferrovum myxofaciens]QKE39480.1 MAG: hypothetical protein HO273_12755 [Ferrovum myxofaciens]QWY74757.1 MAG: hypothetical protein JVY19_13330 [Ferrovum myxofaciens]QWY77503.1 MAG: hypothetical protein JZL65_13765 [Ferrovum myxofaciens]